MPRVFEPFNDGFAFCRGIFAFDNPTLARHGDTTFTGVAPACCRGGEIGLSETASAHAHGNADEPEFRANVADGDPFDRRFGIE